MPIRRVLLIAAVVSLTLPAPLTHAQATASEPATPSKPLVFETASIRPTKTHQYSAVSFTPDGAMATGISLQDLIRSAYNERHDFLWSGGPSWIASDYFDLAAKFDPSDFKDLTAEQGRAMLRALLADRFKLVVRRESKIMPHFALTVARGGPKMQETKAENIQRDPDNRLYCRAGLSVFKQCTMAEFAYIVSWFGTNAIVEDHTGLTGLYDFTLRWAPPSTMEPSSPDAPPDVFTALQEQLGLKLEPIKGPIDTYVIDRVERPSEN